MSYVGPGSERATGVLDDYVAWQHPARNTQIYIHPQVVRTLSAHAVDAAEHGSEIGGVLWGNAGPADSLIIADARLVPSSGAFFNTSPTDARNLQQAMTGRAPGATLSLAGYFRSSIREDHSLTPQDKTVIRQYVTDPDTVFLVIKPGDNGTCTVELSFWNDGGLRTDAGSGDIPFMALDEQAGPDAAPVHENGTQKRDGSERAFFEQARPESRTTSIGQEEPSLVAMLRESAMRHQPSPGGTALAPDAQSKSEESGKNSKSVLLF